MAASGEFRDVRLRSAIAANAAGDVAVVGPTNGPFAGSPVKGRADVFVAVYAPNGTQRWNYLLGTAQSDNPIGVAIDAAGNVAVAGHTGGSLAQPNKGEYDAFIVKFAPDGAVCWRRQPGTRQGDQVGGVAIDEAGQVVVVGRTSGPLAGRIKGIEDAFVIAYAADGTQRWRRLLGTTDDDTANGVAIDDIGNIAVVGATWGSLAAPNSGFADAFAVEYAADGAVRWRRQMGTAGGEQFFAVATDSAGNVVAAGYLQDDVLVAKYTSDGRMLWKRQLGAPNAAESANTVVIDPVTGNIIVEFFTDYYPGLLAIFSADGTLLQTLRLPMDPAEGTVDDKIAIDGVGNLYVSGSHGVPPNDEEVVFTVSKYAPLLR